MATPRPGSNQRTGGRILIDQLALHRVRTVFCVPGESYLSALDALYDVPDIRVITCRHEAGAGFMAEAWGKLTGTPGVALVTRGPGACNAAIAVHTAFQDSSPMLLLVGQVERRARGREAFQEVDLGALFGWTAKWVGEAGDPARLPELVSRAFYTACAGRPGPVVLGLPEDMLVEACAAADADPYRVVRPHPGAADVAALRAALEQASRPLVIVGGGGWSAEAAADITAFAEANALPVACSFRTQDIVDNTRSVYCGDLAYAVDPALGRRVREADLLIVIGARLGEVTTQGYTLVEPPRSRQRLVHVYADTVELGRVFQPDVAICSGMAEFAAVARALAPVAAPRWQAWAAAARADFVAASAPVAVPGPLDMCAVIATLHERLPAEAILTIDAGNFSAWPQRFYPFRHYRSELGPTAGAMGYGVPAAVAAKIAAPTRPVVCFVGDGGFMMTGQELLTALQYGLDPIVLVVNNGLYGTIRMHQEREYPGRVIGTSLRNPDFLALGRSYGAFTARVERTAEFAPAFEAALAAGRAALIELVLDAEVISTRTTLSRLRADALARRATGGD